MQYCHSSKTGIFQPTKFYYCASERCVGLHVDFRKNFIKQNLHHFSQLKFGIYHTISYLAPKSLYWIRNLVGWNSVISPEFTAVLGISQAAIWKYSAIFGIKKKIRGKSGGLHPQKKESSAVMAFFYWIHEKKKKKSAFEAFFPEETLQHKHGI